jgi:hypothetical protein
MYIKSPVEFEYIYFCRSVGYHGTKQKNVGYVSPLMTGF